MEAYLIYMLMPVLVWLLFIIISKRTIKSSDKLKRGYLIVCGILMFLMIACRHYRVGSGDGAWYYDSWGLIGKMSWNTMKSQLSAFDIENGYLLSVFVLSRFAKNSQFVFVIYGLMVAVSVCVFLYRNCDDVVMGLTMFSCLGLWGFMVQGLRQGIAMCICLFAIEFCKKKKPWQFILTVFLATLYHASAVVFLVTYAFTWLKLDFKGYVFATVSIAFAVLFLNGFFRIVNFFLNDSYDMGATEDSGGGFVATAVYLLILACTVLFYRSKGNGDILPFFFYMTLCGFVTFIMRYNANTIAQRVSYYFMFAQMAVLPTIVNRIFARRQKILVACLVNFLCLGIAIYKASYTKLVPYTFFWQG